MVVRIFVLTRGPKIATRLHHTTGIMGEIGSGERGWHTNAASEQEWRRKIVGHSAMGSIKGYRTCTWGAFGGW